MPGRDEVSDFVLREGLLFSRDITVPIEAIGYGLRIGQGIRPAQRGPDSQAGQQSRARPRAVPAEQERPKTIGERVVSGTEMSVHSSWYF